MYKRQALDREKEYAQAGIPMLPVTHGAQFTRLHILLYTAILFAVSLLPLGIGMSGWIYGLIALPLGLLYFVKTWQLYRRPSRELPGWLFTYSIVYLMVIFAALLLDHYL